MASTAEMRKEAERKRWKAEALDERERAADLRIRAKECEENASKLEKKAEDDDWIVGLFLLIVVVCVVYSQFLA